MFVCLLTLTDHLHKKSFYVNLHTMTRFIRTISKIILKIISFKSHEHLLQEFRIITGLQTSVLAIFVSRKWRSALDAQAFGLWEDDRSNSCLSNTLADVKVEGQSSKKMAALSCPPRQRMFSDNWWQWGISLMFHLLAARNLFSFKHEIFVLSSK